MKRLKGVGVRYRIEHRGYEKIKKILLLSYMDKEIKNEWYIFSFCH